MTMVQLALWTAQMQNEDVPTVYFSTSEAAEYLKVSRSRIVALIEEGRFPGAVKIRGQWHIPADEVIHFKKLPHGRPKKPRGRPRK